jgi:GH15 family glucan-1,4-alpha-glucosidase
VAERTTTDYRPIADYGLLSDCHSCALVSSLGSVDWLCLPDFDSPAVLGRLLDPGAGHWSLTPRGTLRAHRQYLPDSMVLQTTFETDGGTVELIDSLALGTDERGHNIGRASPHCLIRSLRCVTGAVQIDLEYCPRPEYGLVVPLLRPRAGGVHARCGLAQLFLSSPIPIEVTESVARATFTLVAGQAVHFCLQYESVLEELSSALAQERIVAYRDDTLTAWRSWSQLHQNYRGPWQELVAHSGRVLQAMTYYPSGAIVAAATTSLPEAIGGDRNWDYRFTWVRDASFTLEALWVSACPDEAQKFFTFLAEAALTQVRKGTDLQIMFGIRGEHDLHERTLPHLRGWRDSRPVRVGNGAWNQRQLDVYGELLGAVYLLREQLASLDPVSQEFLVAAVDAAASRWEHPDQGIWEIRGEPRHFTYSKLMCWVALDRGIRMSEALHAGEKLVHWQDVRERIRAAILQSGWSETAQSFTQSFGSDDLDASALMIPIVGFLPADDHRVLATIDAIAARLTDQHGLVFRYLSEDGLAGKEGSFLLCTFWLAHAQALAGRLDDARTTFSRAVGFANDLGLLAEQVLPETRELLGNFPQAFSHIGLVTAAWAIARLEADRKQPPHV